MEDLVSTRTDLLLRSLLISFFGLVVIASAWICDDAYLTFRTISNLISGYGPNWNIGERVQVYTHPLWMLILAGAYGVSHEFYYTTVILSLVFALLTLIVLSAGLARSYWSLILAIVALTASKTYVDFSTSGLENSLSHLLLVLFFCVFFRGKFGPRQFLLLSTIAGLGVLNRMDMLLLYLPSLLYIACQFPWHRSAGYVALGFLPFVIWEAFSVIYYGFPFPNTAYAKLSTGIERPELIHQGLLYLLSLVRLDAAGVLLCCLGALAALASRDLKRMSVAAGMVLYLGYVVSIGGDFMGSRFLSAPLLCAVILLTYETLDTPSLAWWTLVAAVGGLSLLSPLSPWRSNSDYGVNVALTDTIDVRGVADERMFYYRSFGLLRAERGPQWPERCPQVIQGLSTAILPPLSSRGNIVTPVFTAGVKGYCLGKQVWVVDVLGLGDPLLARLPARYDPGWRIGHHARVIPDGYLATIRSGDNQINDPGLAAYYDKLALITRAPLWGRDRWNAIWNMNLGRYNILINRLAYQYPTRQLISMSKISQPALSNSPRDQDGHIVVPQDGVLIDLEGTVHTQSVELGLTSNGTYQIRYLHAGQELARATIGPLLLSASGTLAAYPIEVPATVASAGYDQVWILPQQGNTTYALDYIRVAATTGAPNGQATHAP